MSIASSVAGRWLAGFIAVSLGAVVAAGPPAVAATGDADSGIEGAPWRLTQLLSGTELTDVPEGVMPTLLLDGGQAGGSAGCNSFSGSYTIRGDSLTFGPVMSTMMLCPDPALAIETAYLADLGHVASYELDRNDLHLLDANGQVALVYEAATVPSIEGAWIVSSYRSGGRDLVSPRQGSLLTAVFGADGTLEGSSGCNHFTGTYTVDGGDVTIGPLSSTRLACASPDLQQQETDYLAALAASNQWSQNGADLELVDVEGVGKDTTVRFTADSEPSYIGSWGVTGYDKGNGSVIAPVAGSTLTISFATDGTVEGSSGCNTYSGPYTVSGSSMTIGPLASTRVACSTPELDTQEQQYLAALQVVTDWATDDAGIALRDQKGTTQVTAAP